MLPRTIPRLDIPLFKGVSLTLPIRYEAEPFVYIPIQSITQGAPARIVCQSAHGLVDQWRAAVRGAKGMKQINATNDPPYECDWHRITIIDSTTIEFNDVVSADFTAHVAGSGFLQYLTPVSLAGCTASMPILDADGNQLDLLTSGNGRIVLDDAAKVILVKFSAAQTAAATWDFGSYALNITDGAGNVFAIYQGSVPVTAEETT